MANLTKQSLHLSPGLRSANLVTTGGDMTINNRRMRVNDVELNVVVQGEGPDVLLVHGFPDDHTVWRNQIPALVDAGYRVIALDTRGCGESEIKPCEGDYAIDKLVARPGCAARYARDREGAARRPRLWGAAGLVLRHGASGARGPLHSNVGGASGRLRERRRRAEAQGLLRVLHPAARTDRVPRQALRLVAVRASASLPGRVSAHQGATVASRATHGGLQLLPREPAPDAQQGVPAREGSGCRHLERRRCLPHRGSDARFGALLRCRFPLRPDRRRQSLAAVDGP